MAHENGKVGLGKIQTVKRRQLGRTKDTNQWQEMNDGDDQQHYGDELLHYLDGDG